MDTPVKIPINLDAAVKRLDEMISDEDREWVRAAKEPRMVQAHHSFGRWMRNHWGLWSGSCLALWFQEKGIQHADDMSGIILDSYWRWVHDEPLRLEEQVKYYRDYWTGQGLDPDNLSR